MKLEKFHKFIFRDSQIKDLDFEKLSNMSTERYLFDRTLPFKVLSLVSNEGFFAFQNGLGVQFNLTVIQEPENIFCQCDCGSEDYSKICEPIFQILNWVINDDIITTFYENAKQHELIKIEAKKYGVDVTKSLEDYFELKYENGIAKVVSKNKSLINLDEKKIELLKHDIKQYKINVALSPPSAIVVLRKHKYYGHLVAELYAIERTKDNKPKSPITFLNPAIYIWKNEDPVFLKFYGALMRFQSLGDQENLVECILGLKGIVSNPLELEFYLHEHSISEKVTAASLQQIKISDAKPSFHLEIKEKNDFYTIEGFVTVQNLKLPLGQVTVVMDYFYLINDHYFLIENAATVSVIKFLVSKEGKIIIHASKFKEFKKSFLDEIEESISIKHKYAKKAVEQQLAQNGYLELPTKIIYLSDFGADVMIIPVMVYGQIEIPVRSKKQIVDFDARGKIFSHVRNETLEDEFVSLIIKQHPHFKEQLNDAMHYFYLNKKYLLDEKWFLKTFDEWQNAGISVHGFGELEGIKINPTNVKISINVASGINWFDAEIDIKYGIKKAKLKNVYLAIKNKSKYLKLDDGTFGILPQEWIEKFTAYFNSTDQIDDESIRFSKSSFLTVSQLFDEKELSKDSVLEIGILKAKFERFNEIKNIDTPEGFVGELREYQKQGLNWLNFLDDFGFGGCLADDMGLGKTVQILAFILSLRKKRTSNRNLLIVPTTLIFNWEEEIKKFSPDLKYHVYYGLKRDRKEIPEAELLISTYQVMVNDLNFLKKIEFDYVFLDESQNIKNPDSQRFMAATVLKARNKIAITGTPFENNTFDLYSQFTFACPGLLGSKSFFRDIYSVPIDVHKEKKRLEHLQQKLKPFLLRRTKSQVAAELPEKTELILFCEMAQTQRDIYDAYEKEFREYISASDGDELKKESMHVLKGITRLRQICDSPRLTLDKGMSVESESAKVEMLMEQIEDRISVHKILVFSQFVGMIQLIEKALKLRNISFVTLTGQTKNREQIVNKFKEDSELRVFLISLKAGGTGLNLPEADYVYLVDPWWNPAVENQAIDRVHRIGQTKKVIAVRLIAKDTIEEKMMLLQQSKKELAEDLIKEETSFLKNLSKEDLLALL